MHDDTLPKTEQAPGDLIQDEPLLTYQSLPPGNDDPLAALMSRLPDEASFCTPTLQALFFDTQQHNSALHQAQASNATANASATESATKPAAVSASALAGVHYPLHPLNQHGRDPARNKAAELAVIQHAALEPQMQNWCRSYPDRYIEEKIRAVATVIVTEKGYFGLGMDEQSMLLYDIRFLLASHHHLIADADSWLQQHQPPEQNHGAYFYPVEHNLELAELWLYKRLADGDVVETMSGLKPSPEFAQTIQQVLTAYTWG